MTRGSGYLRPWIWIGYGILFLVAIPWYWPEGDERILFGFPLWVIVSVGVSFLISCYTAWLFLSGWPDREEEE